jgi:hypothetical protein
MAEIDIDKVRTAIEARLDEREQPDLTETEQQVVDNYVSPDPDPEELPQEVTNALERLREDFYKA